MENSDLAVLRSIHTWRQMGENVLLATVVRTWGSSPRPIGSIMALCETGAVAGSVSGGCIEDDLIHEFTGGDKKFLSTQPELRKYGVTAEEAHRFGLPCGGTLELVLEFNPDVQLLSEIIQQLESRRLVCRITNLKTGTVELQDSQSPAELEIDEYALRNTFGPSYRMLLIGAGQTSEYLATMALFSGFSVTVCDPRDEYRRSWAVGNVSITSEMPDDLIQSFNPDKRSCVIALTHDPKLDDLALIEAIHTEAFYVGAIGSRRNTELRRMRMIEHFDQSEESLENLRGPIGIYIGSKTPSEIAISIMAEVIAIKNNIPLPNKCSITSAKNSHDMPATSPNAVTHRKTD